MRVEVCEEVILFICFLDNDLNMLNDVMLNILVSILSLQLSLFCGLRINQIAYGFITEKSEASPTNHLVFDDKLSNKSLMYIRKSPSIEP